MRAHFCEYHPEGKRWADGPVAPCPYHSKNRKQRGVKPGRRARRRMDREAGVVGIDRGSHITGT